jgi:hypothetical protein
MNANAVAKHYDKLTPEERFRLILAAGARGDKGEQTRLAAAGGRITLSMQDHAPYGHAFEELALTIFLDLLEVAAFYLDPFHRLGEARDIPGDDDLEEPDDQGKGADGDDGAASAASAEPAPEDGDDPEADRVENPAWQRALELTLIAGFQVKTKAAGWKLFCERLNLPPFALWEWLPGLDRLQHALKMAESAAFVPEGAWQWMNDHRPAGHAEITESDLISAEAVADELEAIFRRRVKWWGG